MTNRIRYNQHVYKEKLVTKHMEKNMKFAFSTKAKTLEQLKNKLKKSKIPEFIYFTLDDWSKNKERILEKIHSSFKKKIVVRSSALNEDSQNSSLAGAFESILDVDPKSVKNLKDAIEIVFKSYEKKDSKHKDNQIIVQEQITKVQLSGVIFTKDIETGSPYYIINYDDYSGRTDIITSGNGKNNKIFTYYKNCGLNPSDKYLNQIISCVKEIEDVTKNDAIDIEFVISDEIFYTLQARPIATLKNSHEFNNEKFKKTLESIKLFIKENNIPFPNLAGKNVAYGIMPDWNPAEIIGVDPKPFAFSLYRYLITDEIWPLSRKKLGYRNIGYHPGICSLGGKPYIDIRMSFNTFIPADIEEELAEKLIEFYMNKLRRYQDYHDKVEFNIVYTCYRFDFDEISKELKDNGFFEEEIKQLKKSIFNLTNNIITEKITSIESEMKKTTHLAIRRNKIIKSKCTLPVKIAQLGHECRIYGTLPFSKLARFAFIGTILMKTLLIKKIITQEEYDKFFASIKTVATDFLEALEELKNENITLDEFLEKYGHLRPGTYDICSKSYKENFNKYIDLAKFKAPKKQEKFEFNNKTKKRIELELKKHGFELNAEEFLSFVKRAIISRERSKFEFTKNLSLMLEYSEQLFSQHGIPREDIAFLNINDIFRISHSSLENDMIDKFKNKITRNKEQYALMKSIKLPPLIFMEKSVDYFRSTDNMPNFITQKSICADVIDLSSNFEIKDLEGKIVLIENADPGYDWIFSHNISGLITEFGGAASHMAIRTAEFKLPSAIGCGSTLFGILKGVKNIELNCAAKQIKVIF